MLTGTFRVVRSGAMKTVALACDHAGFSLKNEVLQILKKFDCEVVDHGTSSDERVDYPDFAAHVAKAVQEGKADCGVLICGSGIGMALTANRFAGIRAASITDVYSARMARAHNDLNVLCLGSRVVGPGLAEELIAAFLNTSFEEGRHTGRVAKIHSYD